MATIEGAKNQRLIDLGIKLEKKAQRAIDFAGFNEPGHYRSDGSGYCHCLPAGRVEDHNYWCDLIRGGVKK